MNNTLPTHQLLAHIKQHFYPPDPTDKHFHQDQRILLYALTWPAAWLDARALRLPPQRYETLIMQRLDAIVLHGDPAHYQQYFPRYLLKTLQDWFAWHGEDLYHELKHIRNCLPDIETLLQTRPTQTTHDTVAPLARAHAVLAIQYHRKKQAQPTQLKLF
jgi:hypothetical protein